MQQASLTTINPSVVTLPFLSSCNNAQSIASTDAVNLLQMAGSTCDIETFVPKEITLPTISLFFHL